MKLTKKKLLIAVLTIIVLAGAGVYAATSYGTESDPLITKSYLDEVLRPQLEQEVSDALEESGAMQQSIPGEFTEVKLSGGQRVLCGLGGELVLTSGSAKAVGSLTDTTAGTAVSDGGSISANHLYLTTADSSGLIASGSAAVLVSGTYALN